MLSILLTVHTKWCSFLLLWIEINWMSFSRSVVTVSREMFYLTLFHVFKRKTNSMGTKCIFRQINLCVRERKRVWKESKAPGWTVLSRSKWLKKEEQYSNNKIAQSTINTAYSYWIPFYTIIIILFVHCFFSHDDGCARCVCAPFFFFFCLSKKNGGPHWGQINCCLQQEKKRWFWKHFNTTKATDSNDGHIHPLMAKHLADLFLWFEDMHAHKSGGASLKIRICL